jgi:hypothetical protein
VHQPEVALLHEVEEGEPRRLVLLGNRDHQPQVGLDELPPGALAPLGRLLELAALAALDAAGLLELGARVPARVDVLGQAGLVVLGEELVAADLVELDPDEVLVVALGALCDLGHVPSFIRSGAAILRRSPGDSP